MFEAVKAEPDAVSPMNISATIRLFREMGREEQASQIVALYVDAHKGDRAFFDLSKYAFAGDVNDPELRAAFETNYESIPDTRESVEVLRECARRSGWNSEDVELLGKLSVDDFVALFSNLDGEDTTTIAKRALTPPFKPERVSGRK